MNHYLTQENGVRFIKLLAAVLATGAGACVSAAPAPPPTPSADDAAASPAPCSADIYRQFDFWVGEWDVVFSTTGLPAGHSVVERLYGGCALRENWRGAGGYSGGSLNAFDAASGQWKQTWLGSDGALTNYSGALQGEAMVFRATGQEGEAAYVLRMTFTPTGPNVRQYIERSNDDGRTWNEEYDLTYRPVSGALVPHRR